MFEVDGNDGWVVPPANDSKLYNDWASENRFRVGDSIRKFYYLLAENLRDPSV